MEFVIEGKPIAWMRAGRQGKRYFDRQHMQKEALRRSVVAQMKGQKPISEAIELHITFFMDIPVSWSKKRREMALNQAHQKRPDLDNLCKFVQDGLNGILWDDDARISSLIASKVYGPVAKTTLKVFYDKRD